MTSRGRSRDNEDDDDEGGKILGEREKRKSGIDLSERRQMEREPMGELQVGREKEFMGRE